MIKTIIRHPGQIVSIFMDCVNLHFSQTECSFIRPSVSCKQNCLIIYPLNNGANNDSEFFIGEYLFQLRAISIDEIKASPTCFLFKR